MTGVEFPDVPEGCEARAIVDVPVEAALPIFGRRLFRRECTLRITFDVEAVDGGGTNIGGMSFEVDP